jgi:hypothetical protein
MIPVARCVLERTIDSWSLTEALTATSLPAQIFSIRSSSNNHSYKKGEALQQARNQIEWIYTSRKHPTTYSSPMMTIARSSKSYHYWIVAIVIALTTLSSLSSARKIASRDLQEGDYHPYPEDTEVWYEFEDGW